MKEKWQNDLDFRERMVLAQKKRWESLDARKQHSIRCKNANHDKIKELNKRYTGMHWYNNGVEQHRYLSGMEPMGFIRGTLKMSSNKLNAKKNKISSKNTGKHWYNNGVTQVFRFSCPEGFVAGMLKRNK